MATQPKGDSLEIPVSATLKVRESLWQEMKIEAIRRRCTVAALAEEAFALLLSQKADRGAAKR